MRIAARLLVLALCVSASSAYAQRCPPLSVSYVVRAEDGKILNAAELASVHEQSSKPVGDAGSKVSSIAVTNDGKLLPIWDGGSNRVPALIFRGTGDECDMSLTEVTLVYHQKRMRLIFNIPKDKVISPYYLYVDSLNFQEGTFQLESTLLAPNADRVPATRWKRIGVKADTP